MFLRLSMLWVVGGYDVFPFSGWVLIAFRFTIEQVIHLLYDAGRRGKTPTTGLPFGLYLYIVHY